VTQTSEKDHTRREIEQEHRMLGEILGKLVASDEITRLRPLLGDLRGLLVSHFAREEAEDGFYRMVEESGPHLLPKVQSILDEHETFLTDVDRLINEVDATLAGPVARIRRGIRTLAGGLETHEAQESELLSDAFYTELGGGS
jgi:hypothetical protein